MDHTTECGVCGALGDPLNPKANGWDRLELDCAVGHDEMVIRGTMAYDYDRQAWVTADHAHYHCDSDPIMQFCGKTLDACNTLDDLTSHQREEIRAMTATSNIRRQNAHAWPA